MLTLDRFPSLLWRNIKGTIRMPFEQIKIADHGLVIVGALFMIILWPITLTLGVFMKSLFDFVTRVPIDTQSAIQKINQLNNTTTAELVNSLNCKYTCSNSSSTLLKKLDYFQEDRSRRKVESLISDARQKTMEEDQKIIEQSHPDIASKYKISLWHIQSSPSQIEYTPEEQDKINQQINNDRTAWEQSSGRLNRTVLINFLSAPHNIGKKTQKRIDDALNNLEPSMNIEMVSVEK